MPVPDGGSYTHEPVTAEELFVLESRFKNIPLLGQGYQLKERFFAHYERPTCEKAEAAFFAWMEAIPPELNATYTPLMLTIEEWGDEIFVHFDQDRITGAFVEGANGLVRVPSRIGRGYGLGRCGRCHSMGCVKADIANGCWPKNRKMATVLIANSSGYPYHESFLWRHW